MLLLLAPSALLASPSGKVDELMRKLSIQEKVGQLFVIAADTDIAAQDKPFIQSGKVGAVLLRWHKFTGEQAENFSRRMRSWTDMAPSRVPLLIAADYESGPLFTEPLYGATLFPSNMALGATGSPALAEKAAYINGRELRALGIQVDFAPVVDVNSNPQNPVIGIRSFGQNPAKVAALGAAAIRGYLKAGIIPVAKHFPGHGDTKTDSHKQLPVIDRPLAAWKKIDLPPFKAAIAAGAPAIMSAHIVMTALDPDLPATLSRAVLDGELRRKLGFQGVIVTDSLDMGAIANAYTIPKAALRAFLAGCDLLLIGKKNLPESYATVLAAVRDGRISQKRLDQSVRRILKLKERAGLLGALSRNPDSWKSVGAPAGRRLAEKMAEKSVTLLSNPGGLLPLKLPDGETLAALINRADRFAPDVDAFGRALARHHRRTELSQFLPWPSAEDSDGLVKQATGAGVIIFGAYKDGGLDNKLQVELYNRLRALKKPIIVVSLMDPYDLKDFPGAAAQICIYGITPASMKALAKVLFGAAVPGGKLPVNIPGLYKMGSGLAGFKPRAGRR
ncbi:MAG TPA: glycoside hydrolase family 3 N-terminal domain-containing protein [Elusimicrobiota bacterium]|nr:glycoside hydrolase family 3 N-terminal domain-containing protein [Elusimicrobiota bacterium]